MLVGFGVVLVLVMAKVIREARTPGTPPPHSLKYPVQSTQGPSCLWCGKSANDQKRPVMGWGWITLCAPCSAHVDAAHTEFKSIREGDRRTRDIIRDALHATGGWLNSPGDWTFADGNAAVDFCEVLREKLNIQWNDLWPEPSQDKFHVGILPKPIGGKLITCACCGDRAPCNAYARDLCDECAGYERVYALARGNARWAGAEDVWAWLGDMGLAGYATLMRSNGYTPEEAYRHDPYAPHNLATDDAQMLQRIIETERME